MARAGYLTLAWTCSATAAPRRCLVSTMRSMLRGSGAPFTDLPPPGWLASSPLSTGKTGVIGFCMGGGFALLVARDGFDAASVNYGRLPGNLEEALRGACPIVANFGGRDLTLKGAAGKLETALDNLGIENSVKEFPTAGHAFLNETDLGPAVFRPLMRVMGIGPDPDSAPEAWQRIEDHFARHLKSMDANRT